MVYTHKELKKKYGSDYQINKAVKEITTDYQYVKDGTKGDSKNIK